MPYRDPDNQNQHPGNWTPPPTGLGGLLSFTPRPALSPTPYVAPTPYVQPQGPSGYGSVTNLYNPPPRPSSGGGGGGGAPVLVGGGGYSGGGGGGYGAGGPVGDGYAVNATPSLGQDPAYLAFLRALGIEQQDLNASAADRHRVINNEVARRLPDIIQQALYAREGISGNFESRGVYRSGKHEEALARARADEGHQITALQGAANDQKYLIDQELGRRQAEASRRLVEEQLRAAGNVYA